MRRWPRCVGGPVGRRRKVACVAVSSISLGGRSKVPSGSGVFGGRRLPGKAGAMTSPADQPVWRGSDLASLPKRAAKAPRCPGSVRAHALMPTPSDNPAARASPLRVTFLIKRKSRALREISHAGLPHVHIGSRRTFVQPFAVAALTGLPPPGSGPLFKTTGRASGPAHRRTPRSNGHIHCRVPHRCRNCSSTCPPLCFGKRRRGTGK
jgi:hypothetical protein